MRIKFRHYNGPDDYRRVDDFLIEHYQPGNQDGNWIEPVWEYMHGHAWLDKSSLGKIGIWEDAGKIVSVVHYESRVGEVFFRVLWRGFDHPGEPPAEELDDQKNMQDTPNFKHSLKIVVEAPNGDFASFCGMWYVPTHKYAYVEPVATDPDYRRMGLGKAAVLEGIRCCGSLGATVAYVGSDQKFYQAIGFKKVYLSECWVKYFVDGIFFPEKPFTFGVHVR